MLIWRECDRRFRHALGSGPLSRTAGCLQVGNAPQKHPISMLIWARDGALFYFLFSIFYPPAPGETPHLYAHLVQIPVLAPIFEDKYHLHENRGTENSPSPSSS